MSDKDYRKMIFRDIFLRGREEYNRILNDQSNVMSINVTRIVQ